MNLQPPDPESGALYIIIASGADEYPTQIVVLQLWGPNNEVKVTSPVGHGPPAELDPCQKFLGELFFPHNFLVRWFGTRSPNNSARRYASKGLFVQAQDFISVLRINLCVTFVLWTTNDWCPVEVAFFHPRYDVFNVLSAKCYFPSV